MSNPEVPTGGESSDASSDEFAMFMKEFGELDQELEIETADISDDVQRIQYEYTMSEVFRLLGEKQIPIVITEDEELESVLYKQFIETWKTAERKKRFWTAEGIHEGRLAADAVIAYYEEREVQATIVQAATLLRCNLEYKNSWDADALAAYTTKKELQAVLRVHYGRDEDDALYKFFDEIILTEGLDLLRPGDETYIEWAQECLEAFQTERTRRYMLLESSFRIVGLDLDTATSTAIDAVTEVLIEMRILADRPVFTPEMQQAREEDLREFAGKLYLDDDKLDELIELFEIAYPAASIFFFDSEIDQDEEDSF